MNFNQSEHQSKKEKLFDTSDTNTTLQSQLKIERAISNDIIHSLINDSESGYEDDVRDFLREAPTELILKIKNKTYYHVTMSDYAEQILNLGLKKDIQIIDQEDLSFFKHLYVKYAVKKSPISDRFIQHYIAGRNHDDSARGVYLTSSPDETLYSIPERLKFFLANIHFIIHSNTLESDDLRKAKQLYEKYYQKITNNNTQVSILAISAVAPPILNKLIGSYDVTEPIVQEEIIPHIFDEYEPNLEINGDIDPKFITVSKKVKIPITHIDESIRSNQFIVF